MSNCIVLFLFRCLWTNNSSKSKKCFINKSKRYKLNLIRCYNNYAQDIMKIIINIKYILFYEFKIMLDFWTS